MNHKIFFFVILLSSILISCRSNKDIVYLRDMQAAEEYEFTPDKETIVQPNDLLQIVVSCRSPELAMPFNVRNSAVSISDEGSVAAYTVGQNVQGPVYRVDKRGDITFPILGKIHVAGYRLTQVADIIRQLIIDGEFIKDPQVSVDLMNFKYTVIGAVGRNGTFNADGDRVTILEAIATAGDIAPNGRVDNVKIIREVDGKRMILAHDLTSNSIFASPYFYLKPNDIVYVEPKYKNKDRQNSGWQIATFAVSIASVAASMIWALKK